MKEGGIDQRLIESPKESYMLRAEGSHFYHIDDWYYVLEIDWPKEGVRTESCWRSRTLLGPYERKEVLSGRFDGRSDGVAQSGIIGWKMAVVPYADGEKWKTGGADRVYMSYSYDGEVWTSIPVGFQMRYTLDFFTGYRTALYHYPTTDLGGTADFDWYKINGHLSR